MKKQMTFIRKKKQSLINNFNVFILNNVLINNTIL